MCSHDVGAPRYACSKTIWNGREEITQQLCKAMKHIRDNDTSGFWIRSSHRMTVQFRCGQRNELPPVCGLWIRKQEKRSLLLFVVMD